MLVFPLAYTLLTFDREFPAPKSVGEALHFPSDFKYYIASDFRPRSQLAAWHGAMQTKINGQNQLGKTVIVGESGFLFSYFLQGQNTARPTMNYGTIPDLTVPYDVRHQISVHLQARHEFCRNLNVRYLPLIIALKPLLHPEHLPTAFRPSAKPSSYSPLFRHLRSKASAVLTVDTLQAMQDAAQRAPVYYRTDSHWTDYGAYVGVQEILRALQSQFPDLPEPYSEEHQIQYRDALGGNEARALGLVQQLADQHVVLTYDRTRNLERSGSTNSVITELKTQGFQTYFRCAQGEIPSLMVFHNSFGVALMPHLARYSQSSHFVWDDFNQELVEQSRPAVVVELVLTY